MKVSIQPIRTEAPAPPPPPPPPVIERSYDLTLNLSHNEAKALGTMLTCFEGASDGPADVARDLRAALRGHGVYAKRTFAPGNIIRLETWEEIL